MIRVSFDDQDAVCLESDCYIQVVNLIQSPDERMTDDVPCIRFVGIVRTDTRDEPE